MFVVPTKPIRKASGRECQMVACCTAVGSRRCRSVSDGAGQGEIGHYHYLLRLHEGDQ